MAIEIKDRKALTTDLIRDIKRQFAGSSTKDLASYTYERRNSHYADARADISVFDTEGNLVIVGREFSGGKYMLWHGTEPLVDSRKSAR